MVSNGKFPGSAGATICGDWGPMDFSRSLFTTGHTHGVMVVNRFYEHVAGTILEFTPNPEQDMLVACLWSH